MSEYLGSWVIEIVSGKEILVGESSMDAVKTALRLGHPSEFIDVREDGRMRTHHIRLGAIVRYTKV